MVVLKFAHPFDLSWWKQRKNGMADRAPVRFPTKNEGAASTIGDPERLLGPTELTAKISVETKAVINEAIRR
jgi:hypothetical protein